MRYSFSAIFFLLFLFLLPAHGFAWSGRVVGISEGDTIKIIRDKSGIRQLHFYGIHAPNPGQPFGGEVKEFVSALLLGKIVQVEEVANDRQGQIIGIVKIDDKTVNEELLKTGLAWIHEKGCNRNDCKAWRDAEFDARDAGLGIWHDPELFSRHFVVDE